MPLLKTIGLLLYSDLEISKDLMVDEKFQTFSIEMLFSDSHQTTGLQKEILYIFSNIFASPHVEHAEFATEANSLLTRLCFLAHKGDYSIRKEAVMALHNLSVNHDH